MTVNVSSWSETPASNTTVDGINIAEGCPAANINGAIRSVMAGVRTMYAGLPNLANYAILNAPVFTGQPTYTGRGAFLHHASSSNLSGRVFVQATGGSAPTMADGDILIEFA